MKQTRLIAPICTTAGLLAMLLASISGCAGKDHYVIAATSTVIGVDIAKDPEQPTPHAKLGYNRSELAIVPTNRPDCRWLDATREWKCSSDGCTGTNCRGAKDAADVLMELRYGGIFDVGASSGIYQRLAVGETAVRQPGASLMFAKNADGDVTAGSATALTASVDPVKFVKVVTEASMAISKHVAPTGKVEQAAAQKFFKCTKLDDAESKRLADLYADNTAENFRTALQENWPYALSIWVADGCAE